MREWVILKGKVGGNIIMAELENNCLLIGQVSALIGPNPVLPMECEEVYNCFAACPLLYS